jgi:hypothetical protein
MGPTDAQDYAGKRRVARGALWVARVAHRLIAELVVWYALSKLPIFSTGSPVPPRARKSRRAVKRRDSPAIGDGEQLKRSLGDSATNATTLLPVVCLLLCILLVVVARDQVV